MGAGNENCLLYLINLWVRVAYQWTIKGWSSCCIKPSILAAWQGWQFSCHVEAHGPQTAISEDIKPVTNICCITSKNVPCGRWRIGYHKWETTMASWLMALSLTEGMGSWVWFKNLTVNKFELFWSFYENDLGSFSGLGRKIPDVDRCGFNRQMSCPDVGRPTLQKGNWSK